jgi:hypothetical protein
MVPRYELIAVLAAVLAAIALAAFEDGTFINAVVFGKCEAQRPPHVCRPTRFPIA